ncbi:DUF4179 domain-containing protein [Alkalihalophilus pseudofirmus]|uniref:DUF4179 domain-containing protein n=1 Tax=Alkalihalophilus pseudofirmus TaxID=79885 RepID=A0AAJ2NKH7_ALKPS|nr:DUF4179 domain-containing protein [Alkalihalophilus pseudofirmus]MDV2884512.1 DUF4179 domain-containing protein [Alkalihalophilus pseudofirmus]
MNELEKQLSERKIELQSTTAPPELEGRLRDALSTIPPKKAKPLKLMWRLSAAALFFIILVGYQFNGFAYYGKKFLGFDGLNSGTLNQLNEAGMGQNVDEQIVLEDGSILTIDGVMTDANQLIMYYTVSNEEGLDEESIHTLHLHHISGFLTNSNASSGTSTFHENHTEIKGLMRFDPVSGFAKNLTLTLHEYIEDSPLIEKKITFPYNPNLAMQTQLKQPINETLKVDQGQITFTSITATPTSTFIEGKLNVDNYGRLNQDFAGLELIANGKPVIRSGSSSRSDIRGYTFDIRYDALPENLETLELKMKRFVGYEGLNQRVDLDSFVGETIDLNGKRLQIKEINRAEDELHLIIATEDDVLLDGVTLISEEASIPLSTTLNQTYTADENGYEWKVRTLVFKTAGDADALHIEGMHFMKEYDLSVEIPIK